MSEGDENFDIEHRRKMILIGSAGFIGVGVLIPFAVFEFFQDRPLLGFFELGVALFLIFIRSHWKKPQDYGLAAGLGMFFTGLLLFYLFVTGTAGGTGHLWFYPFILCSLFILGKKRGTIATFLLLVTSFLFVITGIASAGYYSFDFLLRFAISTLLLFLAAYIGEDLRESTYGLLIQKNSALKNAVKALSQTDAAFRESEERYRTLVERANDGIVMVQDRVIKYANPSSLKMVGFIEAEVTGHPFADYIHPNERARVVGYYKRQSLHEDPPPSTYETLLIHKDGGKVNVEITAAIVLYQERPAGLIFIRDITERKRTEKEKKLLEDQLFQAQRMEAIGTLAGGVAHNFNNLLMGIQATASLMLLDTNPDHTHHPLLKNLESMVQNGADLTNKLLGYAREGRYEVKLLDLNKLVRDVAATFSAARREIRIRQDLADDLQKIEADQGQLEQVLLNLFVNAADAMPDGGDLLLKTEGVTHEYMKDRKYAAEPGKYVVLSIRDTGVGMDKNTLKRVFEPFFTTKGLAKSTGLGLAASYGIIKNHGGYIQAWSQKGKGTTFEICLPAAQVNSVDRKSTVDEFSGWGETVLLVDDDETVIDFGQEILIRLGYKPLTASNGTEALVTYSKKMEQIDLVILDMILPDMSGGEVFDRMKHANENINVLLSSGYALDGQASEILKRGCKGFLQKPYNINQLAEKIREILGKK